MKKRQEEGLRGSIYQTLDAIGYKLINEKLDQNDLLKLGTTIKTSIRTLRNLTKN